MSLVTFSDVTRFHGRQDVLNSVTLAVEPGERIGLVGRNGAGKTTLIRIILGDEQPDKGIVTKAKGLRIGYLPQEILTQPGVALLDLVLDTDPEYRKVERELREVEEKLAGTGSPGHGMDQEGIMALAERQGRLLHDFERLGGWEKEASAKKILRGLGFQESDLSRGLQEFSGGWVMRAVLARLLLSKPDLLILDEPTNHLDLDSLIWLEGYLKGTSSALIVVSHDRVFLNNVSQKIIELRQGRADSYQGDYESYVSQKSLRLQTETQAFENQQGRIRELQRFIDRNRVRASTARRAQSRVKVLEGMERLEKPETDEGVGFGLRLPLGRRGPDRVLEMEHVSKSYGDLTVFSDLNLILRRGERLALVGPNGRGKSTLIKLAAGIAAPGSGRINLGQNVDIGYFSQFQMDSLDAGNSVLEEFALSAGSLNLGSQRSVLGNFLFSGDDVFKRVGVLSGGEKTRLVLAKIMMGGPNLLLLDEPTNHLDIAGRQMLEEALSDYQGTMILISHDRHFINRLASSVGILEDGGLSVYPGDYDDYREIWLKKAEGENPPTKPQGETSQKADPSGGQNGKGKGKPVGRPKGRPDGLPDAPSGKQRGSQRGKHADPNKKSLDRERKKLLQAVADSERALDALGAKLREVEEALSNPATYQNQELLKGLLGKSQELKKEEKDLEDAYEGLLRDLEALG
ncbi:MAG: ATP-binding cassette domain-containing protein [Deltaproteobacteria bacterium]|jgi:ATP-binding cassette subfamily F protein 3|nr:ATP-binding cassette domain-containing protein [Deltaproteobacteria bacterium]